MLELFDEDLGSRRLIIKQAAAINLAFRLVDQDVTLELPVALLPDLLHTALLLEHVTQLLVFIPGELGQPVRCLCHYFQAQGVLFRIQIVKRLDY